MREHRRSQSLNPGMEGWANLYTPKYPNPQKIPVKINQRSCILNALKGLKTPPFSLPLNVKPCFDWSHRNVNKREKKSHARKD